MQATRAYHLILAVSAIFVASCGTESPSSTSTADPAPTSGKALIVSAAASTKDVVEKLCGEFSESTGIEVKVNAGPSNALASQILAGAPADLFLSANQQWADEVAKANLADATAPLLTTRLVLAVPKENPANIHEPGDLLSDKVKKVALAGESVPAGMYADQALAKLQLLKPLADQRKIARGPDVRSALSYVERGEAEAGIVYSTDVRIAPGLVAAYEFDPKLHDEIVYVLVLLKHDGANPAARKLYDFLQSSTADVAYQEFGFTRLPAGESK